MKKNILDVIIPTYDHPQMLLACLNSYNMASSDHSLRPVIHFWIVNNGKAPLKNYIVENESVTILEPGTNLGWEGGLKYALERCSAPFVLFSNDDIRLLEGQKNTLWSMLASFNDPSVGAVGPSSNYVMGAQNIFQDIVWRNLEVKYLIGFCLMVRREALEKAGGVDDTLPGGDDIDLSIRLRDAGYRLVCRRDLFVYHHGSITGNAVHSGYWNSATMQEKTNLALIRKHGMLKFFETVLMGWNDFKHFESFATEDIEGDICRKHVVGENVLELGCGGNKTVPNALGVDLFQNGDVIPLVTQGKGFSVADLVADVSVGLPVPPESQDTIIGRHILEHCQDALGTLATWNAALKMGGTLILALPNQNLGNTIVQNPEHMNTFVPDSLKNVALCAGFFMRNLYTDVNGVSFVAVFEKRSQPVHGLSVPQNTFFALVAKMEPVYA